MKLLKIKTGFFNDDLFPVNTHPAVNRQASANNFASALWHALHGAFPDIEVEVRHRPGNGELPPDLATVITTDIPADLALRFNDVIEEKLAISQRVEEMIKRLKPQIWLWMTADRSKVEIIKPNPECKLCGGRGMVHAGSVPYGSTSVSLPDDFCECVIEQSEYDEADVMLDLSAYNPPDDHPPFEPDDEQPAGYRWTAQTVLTRKDQ